MGRDARGFILYTPGGFMMSITVEEKRSNERVTFNEWLHVQGFNSGEKVISAGGTFFGSPNNPRIVRLYSQSVEIPITGTLLLLNNSDKPGIVGARWWQESLVVESEDALDRTAILPRGDRRPARAASSPSRGARPGACAATRPRPHRRDAPARNWCRSTVS